MTTGTQKELEQTVQLVPDTGVPTCVALRKRLETNTDQELTLLLTHEAIIALVERLAADTETEKFRRQIQTQ